MKHEYDLPVSLSQICKLFLFLRKNGVDVEIIISMVSYFTYHRKFYLHARMRGEK
jgi:hypothetical protein